MMKRVAQWSFLFSLSLVIALIIGELSLRLYDFVKGVSAPYTHNLPECLAVPNGYYNYGLEPETSVVYDSQNPKSVTINQWGFRGPNFDPIKPDGVKRIFCLGGSSTFDPYVSDDNTWASLLGEQLRRETGDSIECINAGRYGYTSSEILGLVQHRILRYNPDLIVLYSTFNDSRKVMSPFFGADDFPQLYGNPSLAFWNKNSALFAFFDFRMRHVWKWNWYLNLIPSYTYRIDPPAEHFEFLEDPKQHIEFNRAEFQRNLKAIQLIVEEADIELLLCTQMVDTTRVEAALIKNLMLKELTSVIEDMAKEDSIPLLDFSSSTSENLLQTYVHFTPLGCKVFSDSLSKIILREKLIEK